MNGRNLYQKRNIQNLSNKSEYKVLLVNGSAHLQGCVARALDEVEKTLNKNGVSTERINVGNKDVRGCIGCNYCMSHGKCVFNDIVNETAPKLGEADSEGLQTMRNPGRNMAFLIKAIRAQKEKEGLPEQEHTTFTNFHSDVSG